MNRLTVRCFGEFDVRLGDRRVTGFESQKVRALLAYLAARRERAFSRDHLAGMLWPEKSEEAARRNLRQALYNLKSVLGAGDPDSQPILSTHRQVQLSTDADFWVDVEAFEVALRLSAFETRPAPHRLAEAVALYRGDFLGDFLLKDSPAYEVWLVAEQERHRERVFEAMRQLIESYMTRGEYRLGTQYALRLVGLDPLSERAHRYLIQLYTLAGRRSRAMAQYEDLCKLLDHELGVEPMDETRDLYQAALSRKEARREVETGREANGPIIPLVGRADSYAALQKAWQEAQQGQAQLTLMTGKPGVGKTRLVKTFLDVASSEEGNTILQGRANDQIPTPFQPFSQVLRNAVATDSLLVEQTLASTPVEILAQIARLVPELHALRPALPKFDSIEFAYQGEQLFAAVADFFGRLTNDGDSPRTLILMLDDLHYALPESFELLRKIITSNAERPLWVIAIFRQSEAAGSGITEMVERLQDVPCSTIELGRLADSGVADLAAALVGADQAAELAEFLAKNAEGLPIKLAEWVNFLWDEGVMVPAESQWRLLKPLAKLNIPAKCELPELLVRRLLRLPNSTRRLAVLAAVMGKLFDAEMLRAAADEHPAVIEVGLEVLLERWLARKLAEAWTTSHREKDLVMWQRGVRKGSFEFSHEAIWHAFYHSVNIQRRRAMHGELAVALEESQPNANEIYPELIGSHYWWAGQQDKAAEPLLEAGRRAQDLQANDTAKYYFNLALDALDELLESGRKGPWLGQRNQATRGLEELNQRS